MNVKSIFLLHFFLKRVVSFCKLKCFTDCEAETLLVVGASAKLNLYKQNVCKYTTF